MTFPGKAVVSLVPNVGAKERGKILAHSTASPRKLKG